MRRHRVGVTLGAAVLLPSVPGTQVLRLPTDEVLDRAERALEEIGVAWARRTTPRGPRAVLVVHPDGGRLAEALWAEGVATFSYGLVHDHSVVDVDALVRAFEHYPRGLAETVWVWEHGGASDGCEAMEGRVFVIGSPTSLLASSAALQLHGLDHETVLGPDGPICLELAAGVAEDVADVLDRFALDHRVLVR